MEIKQLRALKAIAETGSFSVAADKLRLTQSALSHQIKNLEDELGETLLIRGKPRVFPSPAGGVVLSSAERILAEISAVREHFQEPSSGAVTGSLRVAATNLGMAYLYGDLCQDFMAQYPGVEITFRATETPEEAARRVEEGAADVAFIPFFSEHPLLELVALGSTEDVFIVGRSHPLFKRRTASLGEIRQWPFIRFHPGSGSRGVSDRIFLGTGGYPPIATESNDVEFVKRMVGLGVGVALIPVIAVAREARGHTLRLIRLNDRTLSVDFGLAYRRGVRMKAVELLRAFCLEMRGDELRHLTIENAGRPAFGRESAALREAKASPHAY
jgi:DNA-binding transcriptional LysR family regulator